MTIALVNKIKTCTTCKLSVLKWFAHSEHSFTARTVEKMPGAGFRSSDHVILNQSVLQYFMKS